MEETANKSSLQNYSEVLIIRYFLLGRLICGNKRELKSSCVFFVRKTKIQATTRKRNGVGCRPSQTGSLAEISRFVHLRETEGRDVVGQGIDPDVHDVLVVTGYWHPPREGGPVDGDAQVACYADLF